MSVVTTSCQQVIAPDRAMSNSAAAEVLLKLYELRTEPALRQARGWFAFEFHPSTATDVLRTWLGPGHESAPYRMVTSYWDMAASLVNLGAIPSEMLDRKSTRLNSSHRTISYA